MTCCLPFAVSCAARVRACQKDARVTDSPGYRGIEATGRKRYWKKVCCAQVFCAPDVLQFKSLKPRLNVRLMLETLDALPVAQGVCEVSRRTLGPGRGECHATASAEHFVYCSVEQWRVPRIQQQMYHWRGVYAFDGYVVRGRAFANGVDSQVVKWLLSEIEGIWC